MGARPPLTVCGITWNSGDRLEQWLTRALEFADEIVLLVDSRSTDATLDIACSYADQVQVVEHPPFIEVAMDWGLRRATGEWVLWLDDDELVSAGFAAARDRLLADPDLTHYWVPYRWVIPGPEGGYRWLRQFPWHPNQRLRLVRNVGSVFHHRGRLHSPIDVAGDGRVLDAEEGVIYHMDLAWRSRMEREAKVARYRGKNAPSCEEYYLYEDYAATLRGEPFDEREVTRAPADAARRAAEERRTRRAAAPRANVDPDVATVAAMRARIARHWESADVYSADYVEHDTPTTVLPNRGYVVELAVRNTSAVPWRNSGPLRGRVAMSYHWAHPDLGVLLEHGDRAMLPRVVEPGEVVRFPAGIWTPFEPGRYLLQWDLRVEEVSWFSARGVAPLEVEVEVTTST
ncbi:MAG TPA: glycosyltransferase, partial [Acidimicrobiales bacterium]|nr:glycosyltransferase [Acidimicrobiales bacterium]